MEETLLFVRASCVVEGW